MDIGAKALRVICTEQDVSAFVKAKLTDEYFYSDDEKKLFQWVTWHVAQYSALPKTQTLLEAFPEVPDAIEPVGYYLDKLEERYAYKTLNKGLADCQELMKEKNITDVLSLIESMAGKVYGSAMRHQIAEFSQEAYDIVMDEYSNASKGLMGIEFGWPYLDLMTGGMYAGDLICYIGRPAMGKTYKMLYSAHDAWFRQKKNVMFLSLEMVTTPLIQRLAAIHTHIGITDIKQGTLPTGKPKNMVKELGKQLIAAKDEEQRLYVVDGNLASTPEQAYALAKQFNVHAMYVDSAYLMTAENKKLDQYMRVADNVRQMKQLTTRMKIPTVASFQMNRKGGAKKKIEQVGLEDIAYSDVIGQIASIVLGLFEEDGIETMKMRTVSVLKGREGAIGRFKVLWDFIKMNFKQAPEENATAELKFV